MLVTNHKPTIIEHLTKHKQTTFTVLLHAKGNPSKTWSYISFWAVEGRSEMQNEENAMKKQIAKQFLL